MAKLVWSRRAISDLRHACDYIAHDSEKYAYLLAERIIALIESIPQHPLLGAVVPEYEREDLRERHSQNYRIVYQVGKERIDILTIVHAARLLPPSPPTAEA